MWSALRSGRRGVDPSPVLRQLLPLLHRSCLGVVGGRFDPPHLSPEILAYLEHHELLDFLHPLYLEDPTALPEGWPELLADRHRLRLLTNALTWRATLELCTALTTAGIPVVPIKGMALLHELYPANQARVCRDLDLLVVPEDLERAGKVLIDGFGYREDGEESLASLRRDDQQVHVLYHAPPERTPLTTLDLHPALDVARTGLDLPDWRPRLRALAHPRAEGLQVLSPEYTVMALVLNLRRLGKVVSFKHGLDLALFFSLHRDTLDWDELLCWTAENNLRANLLLAVELAARAEVRVSRAVERQLRRAVSLPRRQYLEFVLERGFALPPPGMNAQFLLTQFLVHERWGGLLDLFLRPSPLRLAKVLGLPRQEAVRLLDGRGRPTPELIVRVLSALRSGRDLSNRSAAQRRGTPW